MLAPERATIRALLDRMAETRSDDPFLFGPARDDAWTFANLRRRAEQIGRTLSGLGLARGDKVAFLMDNGLYTAALLLGSMAGGFVAVPLNVRAGRAHLAYTLEHCDATVVFVSGEHRATFEEIRGDVGRDVRVIWADVDGGPDWAGAAPPDAPRPEVGPDDAALLMYTSGSTGQPKGAVHSHRQFLAASGNSVLAHELSARDRSLCVLPLYHINAINVTLVPTLLSGGSVVLPHRFLVRSFWDWMGRYRCTWSALVPTLIGQLIDWIDPRAEGMEDALRGIRFIRSSSAPLAPALHRAFEAKFGLPLIEAMGSTECGGNIFSNPPPPAPDKVGTPGLPYGFGARVVGPDGADVPAGEPGEILLSGPGMMTGYYKNPEGTAAVLDGAGWLHTGDLAYRDGDGYVFIVGRSKELIIKGGMNIAPRQIDEALEGHPAVREAAALGVPDPVFGEDIVAFAVLRAGFAATEQELLDHSARQVGRFKAPNRIFLVGDLPKGPSGKVQRLRMAESFRELLDSRAGVGRPAPTAAGAPGPGGGPLEELIAETWAEVLGTEVRDVGANFFGLGGHSLSAIETLSRLRKRCGVDLSINEFFTSPTVAGQAVLMGERLFAGGAAPPTDRAELEELLVRRRNDGTSGLIPRADSSRPCPLSYAQERIGFLERLHPGLRAFNEPDGVRLQGELDCRRLQDALDAIVARHEALRTVFRATDDGLVQVVRENWKVEIESIDLSARGPREQTAELARLAIEEPRRPFDLTAEPAARAALIRLAPRDHVFVVTVHHAVCDGWSFGILCRELEHYYRLSSRGGDTALPPPPIRYRDYAAWQRRQVAEGQFEKELAFWARYLRGAPAALELPTRGPRPDVFSYRGEKLIFPLGRPLTENLHQFSRQQEVSLFTVLTAAFNVLLGRYTGQDDIVLGIPLANRDRPELVSLFGFLIDFQALRTDLSGNPTFRELLARVRRGLLDVNAHRAVPFNKVVEALRPERELARAPVFQAMLIWKDRHVQFQSLDLPGLAASHVPTHTGSAKYDLTLFLTETKDELLVEVEYCTDLFTPEMVGRLVGHFRTLLTGVLADPEAPVGGLPLLTDPERQQVLVEWNDTRTPFPHDSLLHELFEAQVARTPERIAVVYEGRECTYAQLNDRADELARRLRTRGVGADVLVAVYADRSVDALVGLLGILKAGGAYLPLDPLFPAERLAFILRDADPRVVLTQQSLRSALPPHGAHTLFLDAADPAEEGRAEPARRPQAPTALAYVLYTSGSTGVPKGVLISHRAVVNLLTAMRRQPGLSERDVFLSVSAWTFDIATLELFLPLTTGARLAIAGREVAGDGPGLARLLTTSAATVMQATPATWRMLLHAGWEGNHGLTILCGGEILPPDLAAQLLSRCSALWNLYGPTETTIWSLAARVRPGRPIVIGRPIANTRAYVLDGRLQPVPPGVPGELFLGGAGLARGYLNRPDLDAERFIADPFSPEPGARLYRTGDRVRFGTDGAIEYLERLDHQVKVRGYRIELGEIEAVLSRFPGVGDRVVTVRESSAGGEKMLVGYLVPMKGAVLDTDRVRTFLAEQLPAYMTPSVLVVLDRLPLTPSGKLDRSALPDPHRTALAGVSEYTAPRTEREEGLAAIWRKLLNRARIGIDDNFFYLGGNSLSAVQMIAEVRRTLGTDVPLQAMFKAPTIAGLSRVIEETAPKANGSGAAPPVVASLPGAKPWAYVRPIKESGTRPALIEVDSLTSALAPYLDPDQPFVALNTGSWLDERIPPYYPCTSVEEMAVLYLEALRAFQPSGPYYLTGFCLGARVAYEMARHLAAAGERIAFLGLIDAFPPYPPDHTNKQNRVLRALRGGGRRALFLIWERLRDALTDRINAASRFVRQQLGVPLSLDLLAWRKNRMQSVLARAYHPKSYGGRITVFHSSDTRSERVELWSKLVGGGVEAYSIPGHHLSMVAEPNLKHLARHLNECLHRVRSG